MLLGDIDAAPGDAGKPVGGACAQSDDRYRGDCGTGVS